MTKRISLENAPSHFCLNDPNLTKSSTMAYLKRRLTSHIDTDFKNLSERVLDQKDSNLCVPISVSVLLDWVIRNDCSGMIKAKPLIEIFTILTMVIYPRSFAGFNLNPKKVEKKFQVNQIELLLKRLKYETYFNEVGWEIIRGRGFLDFDEKLDFDFEKGNFSSCRHN